MGIADLNPVPNEMVLEAGALTLNRVTVSSVLWPIPAAKYSVPTQEAFGFQGTNWDSLCKNILPSGVTSALGTLKIVCWAYTAQKHEDIIK